MADELQLGSDVYDRLIAAERALSPALTQCKKAAKCKMQNIAPLAATAEELQSRLQLIRDEFFPNGRPQ